MSRELLVRDLIEENTLLFLGGNAGGIPT